MGFLKKVALFLILIGIKERFEIQIYAIYSILAVFLLMGVVLRPFKSQALNFLRSLSDLTLLLYFLFIHLSDRVRRELQEMSK